MSCPNCGNDIDEELTCSAVREDVPFVTVNGEENVVSVILPVHHCAKCEFKWTDQNGSVIRDFAVAEARAAIAAVQPGQHSISLRDAYPRIAYAVRVLDLIKEKEKTGQLWSQVQLAKGGLKVLLTNVESSTGKPV